MTEGKRGAMFGHYKYIDIKMPAQKSYEDEKVKGRERRRERENAPRMNFGPDL